MKYILFLQIGLVILLTSCKNKKSNTVQSLASDTSSFYDTKSFFTEEINDIKAQPYIITNFTSINDSKKDSSKINAAEFEKIAQQFIQKDIANKELKPYYKETVFRDLTTNSVVFDYTTKDSTKAVQNLHVLINEETSKVNSIYIKSIESNKDSTIEGSFNWTKGESFIIVKTIAKSDGSSYTTQQFVNWHF